jgi:hypothetical protein
MFGIEAPWLVAAATAISVAAARLLYETDGFQMFTAVRAVRRIARHVLVALALLCPPAATAAVAWVVTQEQTRIMNTIVEPVLEKLATSTTTEP